MVETLSALYPTISLWPQGKRDVALAREMGFHGRVLQRSVGAFDAAIDGTGADYVGTRLHAGIRALQFGARATVVEIDNRATEIGRDTGLPTIDPKEMHRAKELLSRDRVAQLTLPEAEITQWLQATNTWLET